MLSHQILKNHAGLLLIGDYSSLTCLYEVIHDVNEHSPLIEEEDGSFLGLAYDVRKAFEEQRAILPPPRDLEVMGTRYGVEIIWPVLLLQQRMLRASLAYLPHSRRHQAITYALEAVIEDGLREDFGGSAREIISRWDRLDPRAIDQIHGAGGLYLSWKKAERKRRLAALLDSLDPSYASTYPYRRAGKEKDLVSPDELNQWEDLEWPEEDW